MAGFDNIFQMAGEAGGMATGIPGAAAIGGSLGGMVDSSMKSTVDAPPETDPTQIAFLDEINRKRKSINTGTEFNVAERQAQQALSETQNNIVKATGGDVGGTMAGLNKAQRVQGKNINDIMAQGAQNEKFYTQMAGGLMDSIAQRRLGLQADKYAQAEADKRDASKGQQGNFASGVAHLPKGLFGGGGVTPQSLPGFDSAASGASAELGAGDLASVAALA